MEIKKVIRSVVPKPLLDIGHILRGDTYGFLAKPNYSEDGLVTYHVPRFINDHNFTKAYAAGVSTGALVEHPEHRRWRTYTSCWAAKHAMRLDGDFIECGVRFGLYARAIVDYVNFSSSKKTFYLFDTYDGTPEERLTNEEVVNGLDNSSLKYDFDCFEHTKHNFIEFENVKVIRGVLPECLENHYINKVAYLAIDLNNAASEMGVIEYLWERLVIGAVVVLHDYAYSDQFSVQARAWEEFSNDVGVSILTIPTGQGLIIKTH